MASDEEDLCSICLVTLRGEDCTWTSCKHKFHSRCLRAWQNSSSELDCTCPNCRRPLDSETVATTMCRLRNESAFLSTLTQRMVERANCAWLRVVSARRALNLYLERNEGPANRLALGFMNVERSGLQECSHITYLLTELSRRCVMLKNNLSRRTAAIVDPNPNEDISQWARETLVNLQRTEVFLLTFVRGDAVTSSDFSSSSLA